MAAGAVDNIKQNSHTVVVLYVWWQFYDKFHQNLRDTKLREIRAHPFMEEKRDNTAHYYARRKTGDVHNINTHRVPCGRRCLRCSRFSYGFVAF